MINNTSYNVKRLFTVCGPPSDLSIK